MVAIAVARLPELVPLIGKLRPGFIGTAVVRAGAADALQCSDLATAVAADDNTRVGRVRCVGDRC